MIFGTGPEHPQWMGDDAGYVACHGRVYRRRGKAITCLFGCPSGPYEWANITGSYPDPDDYVSMCRSCHARYDGAVLSMTADFRGSKRRNSKLTEDKIREARVLRQQEAKLKDLAEALNVSSSTLSEAINGKGGWRWAM